MKKLQYNQFKRYVKNLLESSLLKSISCRKINGGYTSHIFEINFDACIMTIESNFRIRDSKRTFLNFNDLWIDKERNELSDEEFFNQKNIEKTYLEQEITALNSMLLNQAVKKVKIADYGDIVINLQNGIIIEIINDTHLEYSTVCVIREKFSKEEVILSYCNDSLNVEISN